MKEPLSNFTLVSIYCGYAVGIRGKQRQQNRLQSYCRKLRLIVRGLLPFLQALAALFTIIKALGLF
ncbi:MAG: hypothetical protein PUP91_17130 [Rhizonema sp. PD37]|nr:hypothetical protein [Rhizonema sp. PD37]